MEIVSNYKFDVGAKVRVGEQVYTATGCQPMSDHYQISLKADSGQAEEIEKLRILFAGRIGALPGPTNPFPPNRATRRRQQKGKK